MGIRRGSKDPEPLLDRIAPFLCTRVNLTWTMNPIFRIVSHFQPVRDPTRQPTQCEHHREHLGWNTDSSVHDARIKVDIWIQVPVDKVGIIERRFFKTTSNFEQGILHSQMIE